MIIIQFLIISIQVRFTFNLTFSILQWQGKAIGNWNHILKPYDYFITPIFSTLHRRRLETWSASTSKLPSWHLTLLLQCPVGVHLVSKCSTHIVHESIFKETGNRIEILVFLDNWTQLRPPVVQKTTALVNNNIQNHLSKDQLSDDQSSFCQK